MALLQALQGGGAAGGGSSGGKFLTPTTCTLLTVFASGYVEHLSTYGRVRSPCN